MKVFLKDGCMKYGKKVTYYAPFDKCDRVEDYKVAWKHFEEVFKGEEKVLT